MTSACEICSRPARFELRQLRDDRRGYVCSLPCLMKLVLNFALRRGDDLVKKLLQGKRR
jgi:hypothetical protein